MPIGGAVYQLIQSAIGTGLGEEDFWRSTSSRRTAQR